MQRFIYDLNFVKERESLKLFNVVSLFAGGGGSSTGYRLAGGEILAINEFIPAAQEAYRKNYPSTFIFKDDIRKLTGDMILKEIGLKKGDLDILDGSPPCASFSSAGLREKGWGKEKKYSDSSQRTDDLFFEFARILKDIQPKVFICENVKGITMGAANGLLGSSQINIFEDEPETIFQSLTSAGYKVRYKVLNAKDFGVPQMRERTIFIGVRNDYDIDISYPINKNDYNYVSVEDAIYDIIPDVFGKLSAIQYEVYDLQKHGESMYECGVRLNRKLSGTTKRKSHRYKPCNTILARPEIWHYEDKRTLSINELIRISTFPEDYYLGKTFINKWERLGRAVPPLMMKGIAEHVYNNILKKINNI